MEKRFDAAAFILPLMGISLMLFIWTVISLKIATDLPSPLKTWQESQQYILDPFFKDGEMNQGILRFAFLSLVRVAKGFFLAIALGTPLGFLLGLSPKFNQAFDPVIQVLRPISPLAWLPLGLVIFKQSEPAALFTIAICAMWPTVINTAMGVRSIATEYLNVGRVLKLSPMKDAHEDHDSGDTALHVHRLSLSLGMAWLVIVAAEMLTGSPGLGGFLWQEYNSLVYSHILLSVLAIGLIGFVLDRLMGVVERRFKSA